MTGFEFREQRLDFQLTQPQLGETMIRKWEKAATVPLLAELAIIGLSVVLDAGDDPEPELNGTAVVRGAA
jgi:hypothetical protein